MEMTVKANQFAGSMLKPGIRLTDIVKATRAYIESWGYETNNQNYMHGLGGSTNEQFSINSWTEDIPMKENMYVHCHPMIRRWYGNAANYFLTQDTYLNTPNGGLRLNNCPQKLFIIE
jgi:Xaa-Pro aminopeptidase